MPKVEAPVRQQIRVERPSFEGVVLVKPGGVTARELSSQPSPTEAPHGNGLTELQGGRGPEVHAQPQQNEIFTGLPVRSYVDNNQTIPGKEKDKVTSGVTFIRFEQQQDQTEPAKQDAETEQATIEEDNEEVAFLRKMTDFLLDAPDPWERANNPYTSKTQSQEE